MSRLVCRRRTVLVHAVAGDKIPWVALELERADAEDVFKHARRDVEINLEPDRARYEERRCELEGA